MNNKLFRFTFEILRFIQYFDNDGPVGNPIGYQEGLNQEIPEKATKSRNFTMAETLATTSNGKIHYLKEDPQWESEGFVYHGAKLAETKELDQSKESPTYIGTLYAKMKEDKTLLLVRTRTESFALITPEEAKLSNIKEK